WWRDAERVFAAALREPDAHPEAARLWGLIAGWRGDGRAVWRLRELLDRGELGQRALLGYLSGLAQGRRAWRLRWTVRRFRDYLRAETYRWAMTGRALAEAGQSRPAVAWLADWPRRDGLEPRMLYGLAGA